MNKKDNVLQAIKFAAFSASAGVIQVISFTLLNELLPRTDSNNAVLQWFFNSEYGASYLVALILSVLWNFTFNRKFTFKSANNVKIAMLLVLAFYAVFVPTSSLLGDWIAGLGVDGLIVEAGIMVLNFVLEFLYTRFVVYRNSCDTAVNKKETYNKGSNE